MQHDSGDDNAMAAMRSSHGARLKKSHHNTRSNAPRAPPSMANIPPSIETIGAITMTSTCTTAMATPGQRRRGFIVFSTAIT